MINMKDLAKETKDIRVLYVEDEESVREQTMMILGMLFTHIDAAFDGEDGWQKYQNGTYDIVFTDISMPRMDGLELTKRIKEKNTYQRVVIISAYNTADYLFRAIELGVDGFVLKPIEMEKIVLNIKKLSTAINAEKFMQTYQEKLELEVTKKTEIIKKQVVTNKLTGLQNRFALNLLLENLEEDKILIVINIDNFDSINTIYGYENGNRVIQFVATLLSKELWKDAQLFYLGGDEFAIVSDVISDEKLHRYLSDLQEKMASSIMEIDGNIIKGTVTIAVATGRGEIFKHAHIALKEAKSEGKNRIKFYNDSLNIEKLQQKIQEFSPIIRGAIEENDVVPYFQPIVDNRTRTIHKFECLARIEHKGEVYSPFHFIDIAQMIGLLPNITRIMIDKSFQMFQNNDYTFSINITEIDLNDNYLQDYLREKLEEYHIASSRVILEVLEGISTTGVANSLEQLKNLQQMGFSIAIDDFGAQNSNFERVNSMNVDFIKIDGSFVKNIDHDAKSYSIVKTITEFSKSIGAEVIAEFVHNEAVQKKVEELGIEYTQGYYFGAPKKELVTKLATEI